LDTPVQTRTVEDLAHRRLGGPPNRGSVSLSPWTTSGIPPFDQVDERGRCMTFCYIPRLEEHPYNQTHRRSSYGCLGPQTYYSDVGQRGVLSLIGGLFGYIACYVSHRTGDLLAAFRDIVAHTGTEEPSLLKGVIFLGDGTVN